MRKIILSLLLLTTVINLNAQTSICGVPFGTKYAEAERILENKFGTKDNVVSDNPTILFTDKTYDGQHWHFLHFCFQVVGSDQYFNRCILSKICNSSNEAAQFINQLVKSMESKYGDIVEVGTKNGFKYYNGGTNPFNPKQYGFSIDVIKLSDGKFSTNISFGPYNIVKEEL